MRIQNVEQDLFEAPEEKEDRSEKAQEKGFG
jgi:hypothetical protein